MKWNFLYPITAASRTPDYGAATPRSLFSLSSVLNWICWTPPKKIPGYATVPAYCLSHTAISFEAVERLQLKQCHHLQLKLSNQSTSELHFEIKKHEVTEWITLLGINPNLLVSASFRNEKLHTQVRFPYEQQYVDNGEDKNLVKVKKK
jgi:hypothetical protein